MNSHNTYMSKQIKESSYFDKRMQLLGITPAVNNIKLWKNDINNKESHQDVLVDTPIFTSVPEGIDILVYTLDRLSITIEKNNSRFKKDFSIVRLEKPLENSKGETMKYRLPKGAGTHPFFPPVLVEKFEKKISIKTLYLVEGYFKAFKASMHGADIIGLSSITHMKDKDTGKLHPDILRIITMCSVKNIVWLTDGDAIDITQKEITENKDLSIRPKNFFSSVTTFKNLLNDYGEVEKWFMHIDTDQIMERSQKGSITRDQVKGIDDLLITYNGKEKEIVSDMQSLIAGNGAYFQKFYITYGGMNKVFKHFHLFDVNDFYFFHVERRPELTNKEFKFNGTLYSYDEKEAKCMVRVPSEANLYFRVGDNYFKFFKKPNQFLKEELVFEGRLKGTLIDDHGKKFTTYVPKYESFINVPGHMSFQPVINNCFNTYSPLDYQPEEDECTEEDCPTIIGFLRHIFGDKIVGYTDPVTKEKKEYSNLDLALDYVQILYHDPAQKLPIICLVSRDNVTGKSSFANFLRLMLGANVAIVGNADLLNDFNAHWACKLVVVCDETKIDKMHVVERVKALSTAQKIFMNAKGRGQVELDCFIKFVLISNNEDNFIYASDDDVRYWVNKVPVLKQENPHILAQLAEEIPQFLSYLNKRILKTEHKNRMWFHPALLKTEALRKVIAYSQPTIEKELRYYFHEIFLDTGLQEILMTQADVHKVVFNNKQFEGNYLQRILKENLKVEAYHVWTVDGETTEYITEAEAVTVATQKFKDTEGYLILGRIQKKPKVRRYSYPRWEEQMKDGKKVNVRVEVENDPGRPYVFKRADFVKPEESGSVILSDEVKFIAQTVGPSNGSPAADVPKDELPF